MRLDISLLLMQALCVVATKLWRCHCLEADYLRQIVQGRRLQALTASQCCAEEGNALSFLALQCMSYTL